MIIIIIKFKSFEAESAALGDQPEKIKITENTYKNAIYTIYLYL